MNDQDFAAYVEKESDDAQREGRLWGISHNVVLRAGALSLRIHHALFMDSNHNFTNRKLPYLSIANSRFNDCDFSGSDLHSSRLADNQMCYCNFSNANLSNVRFNDSDLEGSAFRNANMRSVTLVGAEINRTTGLKVVVPVGQQGRLVYAYTHDGKVLIQAGCRNASPATVRKAIKDDYEPDDPDYADYMDAVLLLEKWGKRELKRIAIFATE
jgi:hypothetical protein